jgi:hypothetical protein
MNFPLYDANWSNPEERRYKDSFVEAQARRDKVARESRAAAPAAINIRLGSKPELQGEYGK